MERCIISKKWEQVSFCFLVTIMNPVHLQMYPPAMSLSFPPSPQVSVFQVGVPPPLKIHVTGSRQNPIEPCPESQARAMPMPIAAPMPAARVGPMPFPPPLMPRPPPPPQIMFPYPPQPQPQPQIRYITDIDSSSSSSNSESDSYSYSVSSETKEYSSIENYRRRRRRFQKLARRRMNYRQMMNSDNLKPMFSFINDQGNMKMRKMISENEAADLLTDNSKVDDEIDNNMIQNVKLVAEEDRNKKQKLVLTSEFEETSNGVASQKKKGTKRLILRKSGSQQKMHVGKKDIVFKPPDNKKITNLTVSFQVV